MTCSFLSVCCVHVDHKEPLCYCSLFSVCLCCNLLLHNHVKKATDHTAYMLLLTYIVIENKHF